MFLNDVTLYEACEQEGLVVPFDPEHPNIEGPTVDLTLAQETWDPYQKEWVSVRWVHPGTKRPAFLFRQGEPWICVTREKVNMPMRALGILSGKTRWAREFLQVVYAGFVQPGHSDRLVLEIKYDGRRPNGLWVEVGQPIVQMAVGQLISVSSQAYVPHEGMTVPYPEDTEAIQQNPGPKSVQAMLDEFNAETAREHAKMGLQPVKSSRKELE